MIRAAEGPTVVVRRYSPCRAAPAIGTYILLIAGEGACGAGLSGGEAHLGRYVLTKAAVEPVAAERRLGPQVGEPPLIADPRRWGSLIGLIGGMTFVVAYSPPLGGVAAVTGCAAGLGRVVAALYARYIRPVGLGALARPRPLALAVYCGCVLVELGVIAVGSRILTATGQSELRLALIASVVGVHFVPLAWAFQERMFCYLGGAVAVLGAAGLVAGALGVSHSADALAAFAGLVMIAIINMYAQGRFVPRR